MNRWRAVVIAVAGGAAVGYATLLFAANGLAEIGWVRAFVGKPWPEWTDPLVGLGIILAGLLLWAFFGWLIWAQLRGRPTDPPAAG